MAATRTESRAREIFSTLEYGPVPESHACVLVRACLASAAHPPPLYTRPAPFCARTPVTLCGSSATPPPLSSRDFCGPVEPTPGGRSLEYFAIVAS